MEFQETYSLLLALVMILYSFMISAFTIGLVRSFKHKETRPIRPAGFVSVIVAVRNEAAGITGLLDELMAQDYPREFLEVILSDDHSEDDTVLLARQFAAAHPEFPLKLIMATKEEMIAPGKKKAIERAVGSAKGEILLFTDADTCRGTGWISSMVSGFGSPGTHMVLGPVYFCREKNLLQKIQSLEFMGLMGTTAGSAALGCPVMCNGANLAYRRDAFLQTGGFIGNQQYRSGDDQFMMSAIGNHYGKASIFFELDELSGVGTEPEATLGGFMNQRLRWVSKSRGYRDPVVITVGLITYSLHLMLLAGMVMGFFFPKLLSLSLLLWLVKMLLEFPMVGIMARFFGKRKLIGYYFIAQVFQLVYVPVAGMLGLVLPYRWKGRRGSL